MVLTRSFTWGSSFPHQQQIILLNDNEGTDTSERRRISACTAVAADLVRTELGPRGMEKLINDNNNKGNDSATITRLLGIVHSPPRSNLTSPSLRTPRYSIILPALLTLAVAVIAN
ncbi:hypothetical protein QYE76_020383 [Lolium multiflorum]|uniref:Uncharacterized protein n=1 Tax=Lolium multiflorum TaxID=4521 RepID=A0AAD8R5T8_LOLMU|nr:hypothetical protein QYE76_020383 [Lolium multiflorum]